MAPLRLTCPKAQSDTGAYRIAWTGGDGAADVCYRLEENGKVLYEGPDTASTVTGRQKGSYVYRVTAHSKHDASEAQMAVISNTCRVRVSPPSFGLAVGLFTMGLVVFVAVLIVVIRGHRAHRRGELG